MGLGASGDNNLGGGGRVSRGNGRRHESKMRDNYTNTGQRFTGVPVTSLVLLLHLKKTLLAGSWS